MTKIILILFFVFALFEGNIASATEYEEINWSIAPSFSNRNDFIRYLKECEKNCENKVAVIFTNGLLVNDNEILKITENYPRSKVSQWKLSNEKGIRVLYEFEVYPGAKVEYAYRTGDTSILSGDERKLYNLAVQIVNAAKNQNTILKKEFFIHEEITKRVSYSNVQSNATLPRHCTAVGALLDGKANCQGYTDSFYMLGRMAGLNVGKMTGTGKGSPHAWNSITFPDGRIYAVDVTWDDASFDFAEGEYNNYIYFNAPLEIMVSTHTWESAYNPTLYPTIDSRYFYCTQEFKNLAFRSNSAEDALNYIAQRISREGYRQTWGMAPYSSRYADLNFSLNHLAREILPKKYNWYGSVAMSVARRGNWIFFVADAVKN